jgi:hypothetical protein
MSNIAQQESHLIELRAALHEAQIQLREVPEVLRDAVTAFRANDTPALERVAERILLGAGATSFAKGPGADVRLIKLRQDVLRTRTALASPDKLMATEVWQHFVALVRGYAAFDQAFARVDTLEESVRTAKLAIDVTLAAMAVRALRGTKVVTCKDLGKEFGVEAFFTALAAECAWVKDAPATRAALTVQLTTLAADQPPDPEQFTREKRTTWEHWVFDVFETAAARPARWAASLASSLRTYPTGSLGDLFTRVFNPTTLPKAKL